MTTKGEFCVVKYDDGGDEIIEYLAIRDYHDRFVCVCFIMFISKKIYPMVQVVCLFGLPPASQ